MEEKNLMQSNLLPLTAGHPYSSQCHGENYCPSLEFHLPVGMSKSQQAKLVPIIEGNSWFIWKPNSIPREHQSLVLAEVPRSARWATAPPNQRIDFIAQPSPFSLPNMEVAKVLYSIGPKFS
ncbi:60S acidic ribosomal protein P0 [Frankliniella fusca]|uniref:60S acidic ribosomal protein P0 n=1 Tax=Frankliniella fusca TaxID=407009 RepID=A0AAE1LG92_9NEOP|nr:60S acidic ribosomal protein P0 [Frankliniella fusca]